VTDIVDDLRTNHCKDGYGCNALQECACGRMADAADEITRLRAELATARNDALEQAASLAATFSRVDWDDGDKGHYGSGYENAAEDITSAIRTLKGDKPWP
jgi:hypothetical protein